MQKRIYNSVITVLEIYPNDDDCVEQINSNFKKWKEFKSDALIDYRNSVELLEYMIYKFDREYNAEKKKLIFSLDNRKRITDILRLMKEVNPYVSLSDKEAYALRNIKFALESGNHELGETMLSQIANDLEDLESSLKNQTENNKKATIVAGVGLALTVIFGLISLAGVLNNIFG